MFAVSGLHPKRLSFVEEAGLRFVVRTLSAPQLFAELREVHVMRLDFGQHGDWLVDPFELAVRFDVSTVFLKRLKLLGRVEAMIEPADPAAPTETRVKVRVLDRVWHGTFDESGKLVREELY